MYFLILHSLNYVYTFRELIENKEQTVEKFYNEESVQEENNEEVPLDNSNTQAKNTFSLNDKNYDKGLNKIKLFVCNTYLQYNNFVNLIIYLNQNYQNYL